ncbi:hypothetical protein [Thermoplasma volcanium GSS1]|uniref:Sodium-dependent phosphate transporter n=1 Tax=Thermoplasma volcanium (strain ATCC 51530 / DSM 4299 / JCM 9571 / NBRC 15438 / GSS1) TaxID=273116 RepID=Q97CP0_THEVO|nr:hypothetical protein [Thermoplasma volcanium GSS1]
MLLSFLLVILVAGNNTSAVSGTLIGSRMVGRYYGLLMTAVGYVAGYLIEGQFLKKAVSVLLPFPPEVVIYAILASFIIFVVAFFVKVPLSLTMALVGSSIGLSLKYGVNLPKSFLLSIFVAWILAPIISVVLSYYLNVVMSGKNYGNIWKYASAVKLLLIFTALFTAFTLGANTIGFIGNVIGFNTENNIVIVAAVFLGTFMFSSGVMKSVSQNMYMLKYTNAFTSQIVSALAVEVSTLFSIPMSNTQTLTSSVLGAGLSYKAKAIYLRPFLYIVVMWIISPILGLVLTYVL